MSDTTTEHYQLPEFSKINVDTIEKDIGILLEKNLESIDTLLINSHPYSWDNLMKPLEELDDHLHKAWSPISHMNSVVNSESLRNAYNACLPKLSEYSTALSQNETLYNAIKSIQEGDDFDSLDKAQQQILNHEIRDFKLAGVALPKEKKQRFAQLCKELSQLTAQFSDNVLDATMGWHLHITDENKIKGLPQHAIDAAKAAAKQQNKEGWVFTLEFPSYYAVATYADDRQLREEMYTAYSTRASDQGPTAGKWDNSPIMQDILQHRLELAQLLGFNSYAEYSLATKMVTNTQDVIDFLQNLIGASYKRAKQEFKELQEFAAKELHIEGLQAWDVAYASEKLRQQRYAISQEELRPYFPEDKVLTGLFSVVNKLYHVNIKPLERIDTWHSDAKCYALYNDNDELISLFYIDLYARENKRGGAWMDDYRNRRLLENANIQTPVAYITCNFNAPVGDQPALFSHDDVVTLFHEFGHSLQHMLTNINYADAAGINGIPWDAVEIASQILENWAWEKESIALISGHFETGAPLPDELFERMHKARNFQSAMQMVRQLEFSLFDFRLHMGFDPQQKNQVQSILNEVRSQVAVVPAPEFNRFQHSFSHIFAGGYSAGYYSYKWAEVMAADAFSLFKEKGIFDSKISQRFLETFLQSGGAEEPMDLFIKFRGRKPDVNALLQQDGIL